MANVGQPGASSIHSIGGTGKASAAFSTSTPAGWAMGIWFASVLIIAFFMLAL